MSIEVASATPEEFASYVAGVWGQISVEEGERLARLAGEAPEGLPFLELVSLHGRSLCYLAYGAAREQRFPNIYSVDVVRDALGALASGLRRANIAGLNYPGRMVQIEISSQALAEVWQTPLALLHIDAEHSFTAACGDYNGFARWLAPGGWLAIHDYQDGFPGVQRCVDEIVLPERKWEEIALAGSLLTMRMPTDQEDQEHGQRCKILG
jgi:hypothetical protein